MKSEPAHKAWSCKFQEFRKPEHRKASESSKPVAHSLKGSLTDAQGTKIKQALNCFFSQKAELLKEGIWEGSREEEEERKRRRGEGREQEGQGS